MSGPLHFAEKVTYSSLKIGVGEYSATNIGQIAIYLFILQMWKHSHDGCVI